MRRRRFGVGDVEPVARLIFAQRALCAALILAIAAALIWRLLALPLPPPVSGVASIWLSSVWSDSIRSLSWAALLSWLADRLMIIGSI
jgi:hypothetical protein